MEHRSRIVPTWLSVIVAISFMTMAFCHVYSTFIKEERNSYNAAVVQEAFASLTKANELLQKQLNEKFEQALTRALASQVKPEAFKPIVAAKPKQIPATQPVLAIVTEKNPASIVKQNVFEGLFGPMSIFNRTKQKVRVKNPKPEPIVVNPDEFEKASVRKAFIFGGITSEDSPIYNAPESPTAKFRHSFTSKEKDTCFYSLLYYTNEGADGLFVLRRNLRRGQIDRSSARIPDEIVKVRTETTVENIVYTPLENAYMPEDKGELVHIKGCDHPVLWKQSVFNTAGDLYWYVFSEDGNGEGKLRTTRRCDISSTPWPTGTLPSDPEFQTVPVRIHNPIQLASE
jgi:hypothetical protein